MLFLSTGRIAEEIGEDRDSVSYAIRKAGIQPVGRAGLVRLFPQSAIDAVKGFLNTRRPAQATPELQEVSP